jgi:hypothetical protein
MDPDPAFLKNPNTDTGNEVHSASFYRKRFNFYTVLVLIIWKNIKLFKSLVRKNIRCPEDVFQNLNEILTPVCSNRDSAENEFVDDVKLLHLLLGALSPVLHI